MTDEVIRNEDGHSLEDLLPGFTRPHNLIGYLEEIEVIGVLDAHDAETVREIDHLLQLIEDAAVLLHRYDASRHSVWLSAITAITENARDLAADEDED